MAVLLCRCLAGPTHRRDVSSSIEDGHLREGTAFWPSNCFFSSSKDDALRHLSRDLLILQNLIECPANDFVAFARRCFQPPAVDDLDSPALIFYEVLRLQRLCDQCYARSAQSQHIG